MKYIIGKDSANKIWHAKFRAGELVGYTDGKISVSANNIPNGWEAIDVSTSSGGIGGGNDELIAEVRALSSLIFDAGRNNTDAEYRPLGVKGFPTSTTVSNFPSSFQVSNFPSSVQVSNFPEVSGSGRQVIRSTHNGVDGSGNPVDVIITDLYNIDGNIVTLISRTKQYILTDGTITSVEPTGFKLINEEGGGDGGTTPEPEKTYLFKATFNTEDKTFIPDYTPEVGTLYPNNNSSLYCENGNLIVADGEQLGPSCELVNPTEGAMRLVELGFNQSLSGRNMTIFLSDSNDYFLVIEAIDNGQPIYNVTLTNGSDSASWSWARNGVDTIKVAFKYGPNGVAYLSAKGTDGVERIDTTEYLDIVPPALPNNNLVIIGFGDDEELTLLDYITVEEVPLEALDTPTIASFDRSNTSNGGGGKTETELADYLSLTLNPVTNAAFYDLEILDVDGVWKRFDRVSSPSYAWFLPYAGSTQVRVIAVPYTNSIYKESLPSAPILITTPTLPPPAAFHSSSQYNGPLNPPTDMTPTIQVAQDWQGGAISVGYEYRLYGATAWTRVYVPYTNPQIGTAHGFRVRETFVLAQENYEVRTFSRNSFGETFSAILKVPIIMPNYTVSMLVDSTTLDSGTPTRDFIVKVTNVSGFPPKAGVPIVVNVSKVISSNGPTTSTVPTATTANVNGGMAVNNNDWDLTEDASFFTYTLKAGATIPVGRALLGFTITKSGVNLGNYNVIYRVVEGSGGDGITNNDSSSKQFTLS